MTDLGFGALKDEQLIELLDQAVMELVTRDPVVQRAAQSAVLSTAEKQKVFMELVKSELVNMKDSYIQSLRMQVRADIADAITKGEMSIGAVVDSTTQGNVIAEVTAEQIKMLKDDLQRAPEKCSFSVNFDGRTNTLVCSYHSMNQNFDAKRNLQISPDVRGNIRRAILGAFGIPTD